MIFGYYYFIFCILLVLPIPEKTKGVLLCLLLGSFLLTLLLPAIVLIVVIANKNPIGFLFFLIATIVVIGLFSIIFPKSPETRRLRHENSEKEEQLRIERKERSAIEEGHRIKNVLRSSAVFVKSVKLCAIPLYMKGDNLILLLPRLRKIDSKYHGTIGKYKKPAIIFSEINVPLDDVEITQNYCESCAIMKISSVVRDLHLNIDPQNRDLQSKLTELQRLAALAGYSELYKQHADIYLRASEQIKSLLDVGVKLSHECSAFIFDILVGEELGKYNSDDFPDVLEIKMSLDNRCQQVSEQYQFLKSEMDEYMNLKNGS